MNINIKYWVMHELEKHSEHETLGEAKLEAKRFKWGAKVYKVQEMIPKKNGSY